MFGVEKEEMSHTPFMSTRVRPIIHQSVQTEASFIPSCVDLKYVYEPQACEQFMQLRELRTLIENCMQHLAGSVHDVVSFKDIMFKLEETYTSSLPVTDMLLLSSKLYRKACELGRLLGCFFGVIFADNCVDEHFHFMEVRLLQRELIEVKKRLKESEEDKIKLQQTLKSVGQLALDHGKAVDLLEQHNHALKVQTSALEDQMALLFHQLNADLEKNCKNSYETVVREMESQENTSTAHTTFHQTIDTLSDQIRTSRGLIYDIREAIASCSQSGSSGEAYLNIEPSLKFKLRILDSNFQQLVGRFNLVKETAIETSQELLNALHERKRILYLSFQHIRLYDLQNNKFRAAKAILSKLHVSTANLLHRMQRTFPSGVITSVDRIGRITTQQWHGGYTLAALRRQKMVAAAAGAAGEESRQEDKLAAPIGMRSTPDVLPGLTEVERMAAESELAALGDTNLCFRFGEQQWLDGETENGLGGPISPEIEVASIEKSVSDTTMERHAPVAVNDRRSIESLQTGMAVSKTAPEDANVVPFTSIHALFELFREMSTDMTCLKESLNLQDEMWAFLKTLTLSVSSTSRHDTIGAGVWKIGADSRNSTTVESMELDEKALEEALLPTGGLATFVTAKRPGSLDSLNTERRRDAGILDSSSSLDLDSNMGTGKNTPTSWKDARCSKAEKAHANSMLARQAQKMQQQQEKLSKMQKDFSSKLFFLQHIYESRISDLEVKESAYRRRFLGNGTSGPSTHSLSGNPGDGTKSLAESIKMKSFSFTESDVGVKQHQSTSRADDAETQQLHKISDKEELVSIRTTWRENFEQVATSEALREATMAQIENIEKRVQEQKGSKKSLK